MGLLQIVEPEQTLTQSHYVAGIDFGTTHSLIAVKSSGVVTPIADLQQRLLLPSAVHYGLKRVTVGWQARQLAHNDPTNTILSVKRLLGQSLSDVNTRYPFLPYKLGCDANGMALLNTVQGSIKPQQAAAEILKTLVHRAEKSLRAVLTGVVITVPAYFDDLQRQTIKEAANLAGIKVLRLLNEPTAAAIAYGLDSVQSELIAVYDLGGGTFDISILQLTNGVFEVLAVGGDSALGGDDFDELLVNWLLQQDDVSFLTTYSRRKLLDIAQETKITLSSCRQALIDIGERQVVVTQEQLASLITPLIEKTLYLSEQTLKDAGVCKQDINAVIMVGGSTRIPHINKAVAKFFAQDPLSTINPDTVVSIGAAIHANILANPHWQNALLLDVTPLSLGIETIGGLVERIVPRNTVLPALVSQQFTTIQANQRSLLIHVVQGEHDKVTDCRSLACFILQGIPPMPAGRAQIEIIFHLDVDGVLCVTAREKSKNLKISVQIKPTHGLSEDKVKTLISHNTNYQSQN